eukprot:164512-Chlamydomonas_euryale.AAC.1
MAACNYQPLTIMVGVLARRSTGDRRNDARHDTFGKAQGLGIASATSQGRLEGLASKEAGTEASKDRVAQRRLQGARARHHERIGGAGTRVFRPVPAETTGDG